MRGREKEERRKEDYAVFFRISCSRFLASSGVRSISTAAGVGCSVALPTVSIRSLLSPTNAEFGGQTPAKRRRGERSYSWVGSEVVPVRSTTVAFSVVAASAFRWTRSPISLKMRVTATLAASLHRAERSPPT